jgi:hypothetical protein
MNARKARRLLLVSCAAVVTFLTGCESHWVTYSPPNGEFRIEFPAAPHEELFKRPGGEADPCAVALLVRGILRRSFEGGFHACRSARVTVGGGATSDVDVALKGVLSELNATSLRQTIFEMGQLKGYEVWLKTSDGLFGRERLVVRDAVVFRWGVATSEESGLANATAERFIRSFVIGDN